MKDLFNMVDFANGMLRQQRDLGTKSEVTLEIARNHKEKYETFYSRGKEFIQYEYVHPNEKKFTMIGYSLDQCREHRDEWINNDFEF